MNKILRKKVTRENFYKSYMQCLNGQLKLTPREFEVLVEICNLYALNSKLEYTKEQLSKIVFGPTSREIIRTKLSISPFNLNNVIKTLKTKGIFIISDNHYYVNPNLFVPDTEDEYSIEFKIEII